MTTRAVLLRIDSRLENVRLVGRAAGTLSALAGLSAFDCAQVELCIVEAVNNCVRHAYGEEPGHPVDVRFCLAHDRLVVEVVDEGLTMPLGPPPSFEFDPRRLEHLPERGMGLFIIHAIMDQVAYSSSDGRNTLTMVRLLASSKQALSASEPSGAC